jgi:hypothetical protein
VPLVIRNRLALATATAAAVLVVASALGAGPDPSHLVLKLADVPHGFAVDAKNTGVFSNAKVAAAENKPSDLAKFNKWGRVTGFQAQFVRNPQAGKYGGIALVISRISVYKAISGTVADFSDKGSTCAGSGLPKVPAPGRLGYATVACLGTAQPQSTKLRLYSLFWRHGVVTASMILAGVAATTSATDIASLGWTLARAQDAHIGATLG